jgi:RNA-directed DNA polymerase
MPTHEMLFDLFICHASEDKDAVVGPLADMLEDRGRPVWVDDREITLGDSLLDGLAKSRFAVLF